MNELRVEQWPAEHLHSYTRQLKDREKALPKMVEAPNIDPVKAYYG